MTPLLWIGHSLSLHLFHARGLPWLSLRLVPLSTCHRVCTQACSYAAPAQAESLEGDPGLSFQFPVLILMVVSGLSQTPVWG